MKHLPFITLSTTKHHFQRYDTSGDYYPDSIGMTFKVSETVPEYEFLIAIHELVEWFICERKGISLEAIDAFDMEYERKRKPGDTSEPGDDKRAPYYRAHQVASAIERTLAVFLGVDWHEYESTIAALPYALSRRHTRGTRR